MKNKTLGNRMKEYEVVSQTKLTRRSNVIIRIDGKAFHTFTRGCKKPFDEDLINAFVETSKLVASEIQGFKLFYHQSDEVSFLLQDFDTLETDAWFDNKVQKIVSVTASLFTGYFNASYKSKKIAFFDARCFVVPPEEVANYFLWRCQDWERNSLQMYARANFSTKELHLKKRDDMHEMLHSVGKNWTTDLSDQEKNGTFYTHKKETLYSKPEYTSIEGIIKLL